MEIIHKNIRSKLSELGWSQKRLCDEIGISPNGFKKMIDTNSIKLATLQKISDVTGEPLAYYVSESYQKQQPSNNSVLSSMQKMIDELQKDKEDLRRNNKLLTNIIEKKMLLEDNPHLKVSGSDSLGKNKECPETTVMTKQLKFPKELVVNSVQKVLKQG